MSSPVHVLLLQQADSPEQADRAFGQMWTWGLPFMPSQMQRQVDHALALARGDAYCRHDPLHPTPHEPEDGAPLHAGRCEECGQPVLAACTCVLFERKGRHAKHCPRYEQ